MQRAEFLKGLFSASIFFTMDGFSSLVNATNNADSAPTDPNEFVSYGAIHLNNTNLEKATHFWTQVVGMKLLKSSAEIAEFGTENKTLVVVHQTAKNRFQKGYSGLYHFAIHAPNEGEFARMLNRLIENNYPFSPVDHTMSKSIYIDDPDGINVEFTLETPERFKRLIPQGGLKIEDSEGNIRSASGYLDINEVLNKLVDRDLNKLISNDTYMGHIHLYATNVQDSNAFYKQLGFIQFNNLPQYQYADLGAGGDYQHRVAMNSWHGINRPLAPAENAGMRHFQLNYKSNEKLKNALENISGYEKKGGEYWLIDPTGNKVVLTKT